MRTQASLSYSLAPGVEVHDTAGEALIVQSSYFRVTLPTLSPCAREKLEELATGYVAEDTIDNVVLPADGVEGLARFYYHLAVLAQSLMLQISVSSDVSTERLVTLFPMSPSFTYRRVTVDPHQRYQVSRFTFVRRDHDGHFYLESPLAFARVRIDMPEAMAMLHCLKIPRSASEVAAQLSASKFAALNVMTLLVVGGFVTPVGAQGNPEDEDETLRQWDFHDLLFHARSRVGRHNFPLGGNFRFLGKIAPQPVVKPSPTGFSLALPRPHMVYATEPGLSQIMESRRSGRRYGPRPITIVELGEFLWRVARVKNIYDFGDKGQFSARPYPSGGASYELEFYVTIDSCLGVARGLYWYSPLDHCIVQIQPFGQDTERLINMASLSAGGFCRPQVLISLAARFQRVSWKYDSIAYATILKNVGVVYAYMYLVGTAMGLAVCALGAGDSDHFARAARTDYLRETSVGEFMIGSHPGQQ